MSDILAPNEIERESFKIITQELGKVDFRDIELPIVKRVIHTTADFDFIKNLRFHHQAVEAGIEAIKSGKDILVDVHMVEAGINKQLLGKWGGRVICCIQATGHKSQATEKNKETKAEQGIEMGLRKNKNIGIIAIGNAPTALLKVIKLLNSKTLKLSNSQTLIIGVPVGFVRAVESKDELSRMKHPFITALGRKGGSPVAAAIINALLKIADK